MGCQNRIVKMNRRRFIAAMSWLTFFGAGRARADQPLVARIRERHDVPALAGMIVTPEGHDFLEVAGVRRAGAADVVTPGDLWHLGSNGKAITAALYARLVEAGRASWGATVADMFPGRQIHAGWTGTTIEDFLSHHGGVSDAALDGVWLRAAHSDVRPLPVQRAAIVESILTNRPSQARGKHVYANANYVIAGAAIERLTGMNWEEAMRMHLFAPLGMTSAGFGAPKDASPWGHTTGLFGFGALAPVDPVDRADNPPVLGPAGTMHMSLLDYAKFLRMFMGGAGPHLTAGSVSRLTKPRSDGDQSYALGWITFRSRPWARGQALAHEGSNTLWHTFTAVGPARGRAVVAVCNAHRGGGAAAAQNLALALVKQLG